MVTCLPCSIQKLEVQLNIASHSVRCAGDQLVWNCRVTLAYHSCLGISISVCIKPQQHQGVTGEKQDE